MKMQSQRGAQIAIVVSLVAGAASAKPLLEISIAQAKEVVETSGPSNSKTTRMVPTQSAVPGDVVQYTLTYANKGDEAANEAVIDDPIPKGTTFIANSATGEGADVSFSSDGGKSFAKPVKLTYEIRLPSGEVQKRVATASDYTHIRFIIKRVPAGASGSVVFRVHVN